MERGAVINERVSDRRTGGDPGAEGAGPDAESGRVPPDAWSAPRGRDLLAGIAVLSVLVAILVVFTADVPRAPRDAGPQPLAPRAAPVAPLPPPWEQVPVARSVSDLPHELVGPLSEGLAQARDRLDRCVALEHRRAAKPGPRPARHAAPAEVILRLATHGGAVHVEGLEIAAPGSAPEVVACARRLLDGDVLAARVGVPGWRQRLALSLE